MKKLIPFIIVLLSMGVVMAPEPCPFLFEVLTSPPDVTGLTLELTYSDKYDSQSWILREQVPGEYSIDIGHVGIPNCLYQNFDLVIKECEGSSICHKTVSFNPQGITVLDVRSASLFITTTTIPPTTTTVPECFTSSECYELCDCVEYCEKENVCDEILGYIDPEDCPKEDPTLNYLITAIFSAISGGVFIYATQGKLKLAKKNLAELIKAIPKGCGIRIFNPYVGAADIKHFHRSPKAYHTLDKRHKEKYDHEGEKNLFPDLNGGG